MTFDEAVAYALTLPGTELGTRHGKPAIQLASNGRVFLFPGREAETSFAVAMDLDTIEMLKETEPETYWQSPHYEGWEGVLVRYAARDEARVRDVIGRSHAFAAAKPRARPRKRK